MGEGEEKNVGGNGNIRRLSGASVGRDEVYRANLLIILMDAPAHMLTQWEQGFVAALTLIESAVDLKLGEIVARVA